VGRKAILRHLSRRGKPYATRQIDFREGITRKIPQTNNKFRGIGRKGSC
jgi:hypothetical protein